jgi:nitrogen fixation/metabolism regulation signal transduction histidine kinase
VFVGYRLSASAAEPVVRLKASAEAMARGDLRAPVPEVGGELGDLATALTTLRDTMRGTIGELEAGEATVRTVLDGLQAAVFLFDGEVIAIANSAASSMFRAKATGWRGTPLSDAGLPASLMAEIASRLGSETAHVSQIGPDPERRYLRVTTEPLDPTDAGPRTLVVVEDTTEARRLEKVPRRSSCSRKPRTPRPPMATSCRRSRSPRR